ncbi:MAG: hypothetical protein RXR20_18410 [Paraburkholderia sp.]|jgi:hypothetical protein|uniref:hypothetical protein n=1 Tax=Burkholderiaceae TaxID=119060 RepID=UPI0010F91B9C|nr:hypothetical protein [Burkholderia sp. 4M9327F10]
MLSVTLLHRPVDLTEEGFDDGIVTPRQFSADIHFSFTISKYLIAQYAVNQSASGRYASVSEK